MNNNQGPPRRPCKFGDNCNNYKKGTCTFLHDNNNQGGYQQGGYQQGGYQQEGYQQGGGGGRGGGGRGTYAPNLPSPYTQGGGLGGGGRGGRGGRGGDQGQTGNTQYQGGRGGGNQYNNQPNQQDNITQVFCRYFHVGDCKNQNCKRPHQFVKGDLLRRVFRTADIPNQQISNLRILTVNSAKYFALRIGERISIYQYLSENGQMSELGDAIVLQYKNMHYFDAKQQYLYFTYENPNTSFSNIGFMDVRNRIKVTVDNAHKLKITGMIHIMDNNNMPIVLSSSNEGTIKVWRIEGDKMVLSPEYTEGLSKCFKTGTNTFEVQFLNKQNIEGNQVIAAGTSDNRLLFWIGPQLTYQQLIFPDNYNKVLAIRYMKFEANWVAIAIIWNAANDMSALMAIDLSTMGYEVIASQQSNQIKHLYHTIQTIGSLLLVASVSGLISIYKVPDFKAKVGCIMHSNSIADMVSYKSYTSTGIEMLNLFVLQRLENGRAGSFSIYSLRQ